MLKIKLQKKEYGNIRGPLNNLTTTQLRRHIYAWCDPYVKGASRYNGSYGFMKLLFFHIENHGTNPAVIDKNTI